MGHNSVFVRAKEEDRQLFGSVFLHEWWLEIPAGRSSQAGPPSYGPGDI